MDLDSFLEKYRWTAVLLFLGMILTGVGVLGTKFNQREEEGIEIISETESKTKEIVVDLQGAVAKPGVYTLLDGSRVNDVLIKSGGLSGTADRDWVAKNINLAQKLVDGQKIYIPEKGELIEGVAVSRMAGKININLASKSDLESLPGVGSAYAQRIIDHRPYQSLNDLLKVPGIGPKTLDLLWLWRYQTTKPPVLPEGVKVRLRAVLRQEPVLLGQSQRFSLKGIKITTWRFPEYHYGDYLIVTGRIGKYGLEYPEIETLIINHQSSVIISWLFELRKKIEAVYNQVLPEPQASLLAGIVLGSKRWLSSDSRQALRRTGTMHVVVASGANISLVAEPVLNSLAGFLSRPVALGLAFVFIWLYALMSGFEAPIVRAAIMASLGFFAQLVGRKKDTLTALILAAALMLVANPLLAFDLGFQLSFSATLGICLFSGRLQSYFQRLPLIGDDLTTTLAAQVLVLPLIYFHFREFSFLSPVVNACVLWTIDPLMKLGGLIAVAGLLSQSLSQLVAYPAWLFLTFFVKVIEFFG